MAVEPTVSVDLLSPTVIRLRWNIAPGAADAHTALEHLLNILDRATRPMHVIVDTSSDPNLPASRLLFHLLATVQHPNLAEWITVKPNEAIRTIEERLARFVGRPVSRHFRSLDAALSYLQQSGPSIA